MKDMGKGYFTNGYSFILKILELLGFIPYLKI